MEQRYYIDTEFVEGTQDKTFLGIKYGETKPTIDLISIGIASDDGREYYAISKDFNLEEAWWRENSTSGVDEEPYYWIRENVLKGIYLDLKLEEDSLVEEVRCDEEFIETESKYFNYDSLKWLINKYGKTNKQISLEIEEFMFLKEKDLPDSCSSCGERDTCYLCQEISKHNDKVKEEKDIKVYGYFSSYDWVVFCQLYGIMMNLPKGLPWYCRDLKQIADQISEETGKDTKFPNSENQHNALQDAKWNKEFHDFLMFIN